MSADARAAIESPANEKHISPASYWELAIKIGLNKFSLTEPFDVLIPQEIRNNGFLIIPISVEHAANIISLPLHHRDPFDRMLIAQALAESMPVVSKDSQFDAYGVQGIW